MKLPYMFSLQGYCENCPEFVPEVETEEISLLNGEVQRCHTVSCTKTKMCTRIADHILNQVPS